MAKYREIEEKELKQKANYNKVLSEYELSKKVNKASDHQIIQMIFDKTIRHSSIFYRANKPEVWQCLIDKIKPNTNFDVLKKYLLHISKKTDFFFETKESIMMLSSISELDNETIRPIETWEPKTRNRHKILSDLLRHLFAKYDVPAFLDKGFVNYELDSIFLFLLMGKGRPLKEFELVPLTITKKAYRYIESTPEYYTFFEAFRRCQILGLGGSEHLAYEIMRSILREKRTAKEDAFWITVIEFFIKQPMMDYSRISEIVDYIYNMKYVNVIRNNVNRPEQPNFNMKGRTLHALLRDTENWHNKLAAERKKITGNSPTWEPYGFSNWSVTYGVEKHAITYDMIQLTSTKDLSQEGADLHHCVASYARSCASGTTSIWSFRTRSSQFQYDGGQFKRLLTVQLNKDGTIVQIRGSYNRKANNQEVNILRRWADEHNLKFSNWAL